MELDSI